MRGVLVLVLLAGCDAIFGVDPPTDPTPPTDDAGTDGPGAGCAEWFERRPTVDVEEMPSAVAIGQLDATTAREIVVATSTGYTVYSADQSAGYTSHTSYPTNTEAPTDVIASNLDGQGVDELVFLHAASDRVEYYADDGGGYALVGGHDTSVGPRALLARDFDGGSGLDLAWITESGRRVEISLRVGSGYPQAVFVDETPGDAVALAAGDIDRNGNVDLVVGQGLTFTTLRNSGNATFAANDVSGVLAGTEELVLANVDGMPGDELIAISSGFVGILRYNGSAYAPFKTLTPEVSPRRIALVDLDGDDVLDLVIAGASGDGEAALVYKGGPQASFDKVAEVELRGNTVGLAAGDLDEDGRSDVVITTSGGALHVLRNCR